MTSQKEPIYVFYHTDGLPCAVIINTSDRHYPVFYKLTVAKDDELAEIISNKNN